jgi:hypothetical protein
MGSLTLNIKYNRNEGLVISPSELIELYLSGIPLCYPDGSKIGMNSIKQKIQNSQKQLENFLSIKLRKQIIWESSDFIRNEFTSWGYIKTIFPIIEPLSLLGHINEVRQVSYPKSWLSVKRSNDKTKFRNLYLIPNTKGGAQMTNHAFVFSGITPHLGFFGTNYIPNYWRIKYCTGFDKVPQDLISAIAKHSAIQILAIAGDLVFGAGIGNQSISIDGISQSYSTTKGNQGAFGGRIKQYIEELKEELLSLKAEYRGVMFNSL